MHRGKRSFFGVLAVLLAWAGAAAGNGAVARTASPPGVELYFLSPHDGQTVKSPVTVQFGLKGMGVAPAGVVKPNTGHHHLIIDAELPPLDQPVPSDANHRHYGGGQTEAKIELKPGDHTLRLLLGDANHVPHDPPVVSRQIRIHVR